MQDTVISLSQLASTSEPPPGSAVAAFNARRYPTEGPRGNAEPNVQDVPAITTARGPVLSRPCVGLMWAVQLPTRCSVSLRSPTFLEMQSGASLVGQVTHSHSLPLRILLFLPSLRRATPFPTLPLKPASNFFHTCITFEKSVVIKFPANTPEVQFEHLAETGCGWQGRQIRKVNMRRSNASGNCHT